MVLSLADRDRLKELGREIREIAGGSRRADGTAKTFDELENEAIEVGDFLTAAMLEANTHEADPPPQACPCPSCNQIAKRLPEEDEPRVLQTDRGEVTWTEAKYFCRRCRKSFFPSVG